MKIAGKLTLSPSDRPPTFFRDDITIHMRAFCRILLYLAHNLLDFSFPFFVAVSTNSLVETPIISTPVSRNSFDKVYKLNCQVCQLDYFFPEKCNHSVAMPKIPSNPDTYSNYLDFSTPNLPCSESFLNRKTVKTKSVQPIIPI